MSKPERVHRPQRKTEFTILLMTRSAQLGWRNLRATQIAQLQKAWDVLTVTPGDITPVNKPLRGSLQFVKRGGVQYERWQYSLANGARIWYFVDGQTVCIEDVRTHHPNETK